MCVEGIRWWRGVDNDDGQTRGSPPSIKALEGMWSRLVGPGTLLERCLWCDVMCEVEEVSQSSAPPQIQSRAVCRRRRCAAVHRAWNGMIAHEWGHSVCACVHVHACSCACVSPLGRAPCVAKIMRQKFLHFWITRPTNKTDFVCYFSITCYV